MRAVNGVKAPMTAGARPPVSSAPVKASTGAALSCGSRTRMVCVVVAEKPSASTAVARSSIRPGLGGVMRTRPRPSSVTGTQSACAMPAPRACTVRLAMGLKASARTVACTSWPGSTGVLGVRLTSSLGALAALSATTRSTRLRVLLFLPSLTVASTVKSPT